MINTDTNTLIELAADKIEEILSILEIECMKEGDTYFGACPVHGGDNRSAWRLYLNNGTPRWCCFTHGCSDIADNYGLVGLVRAMLNKDKPTTKQEAKLWLEKQLGGKVDLQNYVSKPKPLPKKIVGEFPKLNRKQVRAAVNIPAQYYLNRGFSHKVLDTYDVGYCGTYGKKMYHRVVVPIYDPTYTFTVGCSGRSIFEQCSKCEQYHKEGYKCPKVSPKWRHDKRFHKTTYLYNWWFCRPSIKETKKVFIVEGPGDIWRLWEAGIYNAVAILGAKITDGQAILLESSGATDIILIRDNDEAGLKCLDSIKKRLGKFARIHCVVPTRKDIGETPVIEVKQLLKDYL
jgi:5S rRNA maturation endonuclease (ribonuclease M5)